MAAIIKKIKGGKPYYYIVESARVNGKPRIVSQIYLGKAEDIAKNLRVSSKPSAVRVFEFGTIAACLSLAERLSISSIIDSVVPKRRQGISVGTYIVLAAINRASTPCSKAKMADWYEKSSLRRIIKIDESLLASQRFYDAFGRVDEVAIKKIEGLLSKRVIDEFDLDTKCLIFDATNFFTFIDTDTESELAKRGRSKQKRNDLRQIGLALLVSKDSAIPLLSETYPGNRADSKTFLSITDELVSRYEEFTKGVADITLVFDKGNNSYKNISLLDKSPYHFVGSLVPSHHNDLLEIPLDSFKTTNMAGTKAFRTEKEVFGQRRCIVITHSEEFYRKQLRGFNQTLRKARKSLAKIRTTLRGGRSRKDEAGLKKDIEKILTPHWVKDVLKVTLTPGEKFSLTWKIDKESLAALKNTYFGKRILFTDRFDFTDEEIISAYRSQSVVEGAFRQMKDPAFLSFQPIYHHTDSKIRVHALCCVIALMLVNVMLRQARIEGIDISACNMLKNLSDIREVEILYKGEKGRPKVTRELTEMNALQAKLFDIFNLAQLAP